MIHKQRAAGEDAQGGADTKPEVHHQTHALDDLARAFAARLEMGQIARRLVVLRGRVEIGRSYAETLARLAIDRTPFDPEELRLAAGLVGRQGRAAAGRDLVLEAAIEHAGGVLAELLALAGSGSSVDYQVRAITAGAGRLGEQDLDSPDAEAEAALAELGGSAAMARLYAAARQAHHRAEQATTTTRGA